MLWALLRLLLATVSCATEAYFYRTVVEQISSRIGRPMLLLMVFAPGMHISAVGKTDFYDSTPAHTNSYKRYDIQSILAIQFCHVHYNVGTGVRYTAANVARVINWWRRR